jgi:HK97 gp10 family phage protein
VKIEVSGAQEIIKALDQLAPKAERKVLRQAMRKGLKPLLDAAKAEAPVDSGKLRNSLVIRAAKSRKRGAISLEVRPNEKWWAGDHYYPAQVEVGRPNLDNHMDPDPFLTRAFESTGEASKNVALQAIKAGIDAIVSEGS